MTLPPTTVATIVTTTSELERFGRKARPGEVCIYHKGYLFVDRNANDTLKAVAEAALGLEERGYVYLFQRRLGDMVYEYIAMRTTKGSEQASAPSLAMAA